MVPTFIEVTRNSKDNSLSHLSFAKFIYYEINEIPYLRSLDQENDCADIRISAPSAKLI